MRGKSPFGGSKLTALVVALILAAAGALVNWLQPARQGASGRPNDPPPARPRRAASPARPWPATFPPAAIP